MLQYFLNLSTSDPAQDFIILKKIGKGSFGEVFLCMNKKTKALIALKIEIINSNQQFLKTEFEIYQQLNNLVDGPFPKVYAYLSDTNYNIMEMQLLGLSLDKIFQKNIHISKIQFFNIYIVQMIKALKCLHQFGFIHRDIKPDNFLQDIQDIKKIYLIDFGLAKKYVDDQGRHIPFSEGHKLCGTPRYASINAHLGYQLSRRDDFLNLGYTIIYCIKGRLPWQNSFAKSYSEKIQKIQKKKLQISIAKLTDQLPEEYSAFFHYIKCLSYYQEPNYDYMINLFNKNQIEDLMIDYNELFQNQFIFSDYINKNKKIISQNAQISIKQQIENLQI